MSSMRESVRKWLSDACWIAFVGSSEYDGSRAD